MPDSENSFSILDRSLQEAEKKSLLPNMQNLLSVSSLLLQDLPEPSWFVDHYLPERSFVFFAGRPGSYKTFFALRLAYALSLGLPLFDEAVPHSLNPPLPKTKVLFIEEEMQKNLVQHRLKMFTRDGHPPPDDFTLYHNSGFKLSSDKDLQGLAEYARENNIRVIFMDPFSSVGGFENENDNSEVSTTLDNLRRTLVDSDLGVTVVCIHHPSKNDKGDSTGLRGAGDITGKGDHVVQFDRSEVTTQTTLKITKCRLLDMLSVPIQTVEFANITFASLGEKGLEEKEKMTVSVTVSTSRAELEGEKEKNSAHGQIKDDILHYFVKHPTGLYQKDILDGLGLTRTGTFKRAWAELLEANAITKDDERGGKFFVKEKGGEQDKIID